MNLTGASWRSVRVAQMFTGISAMGGLRSSGLVFFEGRRCFLL